MNHTALAPKPSSVPAWADLLIGLGGVHTGDCLEGVKIGVVLDMVPGVQQWSLCFLFEFQLSLVGMLNVLSELVATYDLKNCFCLNILF